MDLATLVLTACLAAAGPAETGGVTMLYTCDVTHLHRNDLADAAQAREVWDTLHALATLQGVVNRDRPRLCLFAVGHGGDNRDRFWLERMREDGGWLSDARLEDVGAPRQAFLRLRDEVRGLVAYDENVPATSNVASTVAGAEDLVAVRFDPSADSLYTWLTSDPDGPGLEVKVWLVNEDGAPMFTGEGTLPDSDTPSSGSAKCDAYLWAKEQYLDAGRLNPAVMGYYLDAWWLRDRRSGWLNHSLTNHDWVVSERGFVFDLAPIDDETPVDDPDQPLGADTATLKTLLRAAYDRLNGETMIHAAGFVPWDTKYTSVAGGKHEPVPAEWRYVEVMSSYNAYLDADALGLNAMANASVFRQFPLQERYPQQRPTEDDLRARGLIDEDGRVALKRYVMVYVGDYDAAAWLYQRIPAIWDDPTRGEIPIAWAFNPTLAVRFAPGMDYTRRTKSGRDYFIAGDSGAGYVNPGHVQAPRTISGLPSGIDTWRDHCARHFRQWDLSITGFIIDGYAPPMNEEMLDTYASFSSDGFVAQKIPQQGLHKGVPFTRMAWDLYAPADKAGETALQHLPDEAPSFRVFRTILWSPTDLKTLYDTMEKQGGDVKVVDPFTFFMLLRRHLESE